VGISGIVIEHWKTEKDRQKEKDRHSPGKGKRKRTGIVL
jgi:hypothetical protein